MIASANQVTMEILSRCAPRPRTITAMILLDASAMLKFTVQEVLFAMVVVAKISVTGSSVDLERLVILASVFVDLVTPEILMTLSTDVQPLGIAAMMLSVTIMRSAFSTVKVFGSA